MKNKGYTLLELLGVIIILSVLVTLVFPSVINFIKKGNDKIDSITNELIMSAAEDYINDNLSSLYLTSGIEYCISVDTLIGKKYLNKMTDTNEFHYKSVKVTYDNKINYEIIDSNDCSVCKLVSGDYNEIGSKYQCKVKDDMELGFEDGYYFYLLSTNEDSTINLIMERNMYYDENNDVGKVATSSNAGAIAWYANSSDHSNGPVTAITYLHNVTKDWNNISNMVMNYYDENINYNTQQKGKNGYGSIKTTNIATIITNKDGEETGRIENLKVRMPRYDEVHGEGKCLTHGENNNQYGSCPLWLSNYLSFSDSVIGDGLQNIDSIYGYWTISSDASTSYIAWIIYYSGIVTNFSVDSSRNIGVRPVITIKNVIVLD